MSDSRRLADAAAAIGELARETAEQAGEGFERIVEGCAAALTGGGKVLFAGNGGSAAQSQHLAAELVCRFTTDRVPYAALALTTDTSFLTACSNDYSFERVFARQVEALGRPGDALVLLSTGGSSPNVLAAAAAARSIGVQVFGFTGLAGDALVEACDASVVVPARDPARIQEVHLLLGHELCGALEARVGGFEDA